MHLNNSFQIWIYGNSFESVLVAIVNPNMQALEQWTLANGITGDFTVLCQNQKAKEYILGELMKIGKGKKVSFLPCLRISFSDAIFVIGSHILAVERL